MKNLILILTFAALAGCQSTQQYASEQYDNFNDHFLMGLAAGWFGESYVLGVSFTPKKTAPLPTEQPDGPPVNPVLPK